jgi:tRNA-dihydrouridine synthase B
VRALHEFYEGIQGVRIARKHVNWFLDNLNLESGFKQAFNQLEAQSAQRRFLDRLSDRKDAA